MSEKLKGVVETASGTEIYSPRSRQLVEALLWSTFTAVNAAFALWVWKAGPHVYRGPWTAHELAGLSAISACFIGVLALRYWKGVRLKKGRLVIRLTSEGFERPGHEPQRVSWSEVESIAMSGSYAHYHVVVRLKSDGASGPASSDVLVDDGRLAIPDRQLLKLFQTNLQRYRESQSSG